MVAQSHHIRSRSSGVVRQPKRYDRYDLPRRNTLCETPRLWIPRPRHAFQPRKTFHPLRIHPHGAPSAPGTVDVVIGRKERSVLSRPALGRSFSTNPGQCIALRDARTPLLQAFLSRRTLLHLLSLFQQRSADVLSQTPTGTRSLVTLFRPAALRDAPAAYASFTHSHTTSTVITPAA